MTEAGNGPVPNAIHLLRTAVQTNMQLSQMADQKANMLIGASMVIFTLSVAQLRSGWLMMPLALLLVGIELMILSWLAADSSEDDQADAPRVDPVLARLGAVKAKTDLPTAEL